MVKPDSTADTPTEVMVSWQAAADGASPQPGLLSSLPMIILIFGIFYFLLIRPQQKEQKKHQSLLGSLIKGNRIVTASGLHGRVYEVSDDQVVIEIADKVRVIVDKIAIKRRMEET